LKHHGLCHNYFLILVAPRAGAWIETQSLSEAIIALAVAPHAGARIENSC